MTAVTDDEALIAFLPDLRIEVSQDEAIVILQQTDHCGEADRIAIHREHVRILAEQFGLLPAPPRRDAALILARRLRKLHERIDDLAKYLVQTSEDDYVQQNALATCEIGDEFIADLDELTVGRLSDLPASQASSRRPSGSVGGQPPQGRGKLV